MGSERQEGRRQTRQLALVLAAVRAAGTDHPTAEEVFARARLELPQISLGTVYRNLQRLVAEGRVAALALRGVRSLRYDPTIAPHDHFVCEVCGRIDDLACGPRPAAVAVAERKGHVVTSHAVVLYGRCGACRMPA